MPCAARNVRRGWSGAGEFALDAAVSPCRVLLGETHDELTQLGVVVGAGVLLAAMWFADLPVAHPLWVLMFGVAGCAVMAALGIVAGIYSDKIDQLAAFTNFIILPLTFLSGVFYSIRSLPPFWQGASHLNPVFYMIDGFRYGFFGVADTSPWLSLAIVAASFIALSLLTLGLLKSGYKLRH